MGINSLSAPSINEFTSLTAQPIPNVPVTIQAYTATGWTAGDYLYSSANGVVGAPTGTASAGGSVVTLQATNLTVTAGLITGNQVLSSPIATSITYTGPTVSTDAQGFDVATTSQNIGSGSQSSCVMTNGNIAIGFYETDGAQPGYYYAIYDQQGNAVVSKTFIASTSTAYRVILVALAEGGFAYGYWNNASNQFVNRIYSATGTLVTTTSINLSSTQQPGSGNSCARGIQQPNGGIVYAWYNWNSRIMYARFAQQSQGYSASNGGSTASATYNTSIQSFALYPFPSNHQTYPNGFAIGCWNSDFGNSYFAYYDVTGSLQGQATTPTTMYSGIDCIRLQDGSYVAIWGNSGNALNIGNVSLSNSTGVLTNFTNAQTLTSFYNGSYASFATLIPMQGSGFAVFYTSTNNSRLAYRRTTGTTSAFNFGNEINISSVSSGSYFPKVNCGTNAGIYITYVNSSNLNAQFNFYATLPLTNNTSYTATGLYPPNYTFLGIAQQTVPAGSVGNIIVNGYATSNSNMPNVSGTLYFDTTQTNMFGTKGYVTGRNFVLKGME